MKVLQVIGGLEKKITWFRNEIHTIKYKVIADLTNIYIYLSYIIIIIMIIISLLIKIITKKKNGAIQCECTCSSMLSKSSNLYEH